MPEPQTAEAILPVARRSWTLTVAVIVLLILPFVLIFPFDGLAKQLFLPAIREQLKQCGPFSTCQVATDGARRALLLMLGPSILAVVASILLGTIGLIRARWRPTSPKNKGLFWASMIGGVIWAFLLGWMYAFLYYLATIHQS